MELSQLISKLGAAMAYYGTFGALPYIIAPKLGSVWLYVAAVVFSIGVAVLLKKALQISFVSHQPEKHHNDGH